MSNALSGYIISMRPETWPLAALPAFFSGLIALNFLLGSNLLILIQPIIILCILVLGATNMFNEVYDTEQDRINKPHRPIVSGKISQSSARNLSLLLFTIAMIWSLFLNINLFYITVLSVVLGMMYSLPGIRLKDNPITSMLTLGIGYGIIMPLAPWFVLQGTDLIIGILIASMGFVWFAGTTNFKDFKDAPGDRITKTKSFVLSKGEHATLKIMMFFMVFIPALLLAGYVYLDLFPLGTLLATVSLFLTFILILNLSRNYSPGRAYKGYKITYFLYPFLYFLLALGFLGGV